ncbi:hypothetical protein [Virgibacillus sp. DJP39]|uniref:hypothetical protein n=1 Tax=Virgibacillus sp. DJP39 TaxID=3409790 RepID=UPI003BB808C3
MIASFSVNKIAWKRMLFFLFLIFIPNYLVMKIKLVGPVNDLIALGTAIDLVVILPLMLYFLGFKKRVSLLVLFAFVFLGLLLANWMIPREADLYLTYFNQTVLILEAGLITFELVVLVALVKKFPVLLNNYRKEKHIHYHFLLSFSAAIQRTFVFKNEKLNKFQFTLRVLATDIAAVYYSLFSWRKKAPIVKQGQTHSFTFHKNASYLGVFFLLVHAMALEIVAVHFLVAQFSHTWAWILTGLDVYAMLFIISDYQAIRLSPVILDSNGIHFQEGIRQYGFVQWKEVKGVTENILTPSEVDKERKSISLALHGLERDQIPYVIKLNQPVKIRQIFGFRKEILSIYIKMDNTEEFTSAINSYLKLQS